MSCTLDQSTGVWLTSTGEACEPRDEAGFPVAHCRQGRCGRHVDLGLRTCIRCIAATRDDVSTLVALAQLLPHEAAQHGDQDDETVNLLGPSADPEAWEHRKETARTYARLSQAAAYGLPAPGWHISLEEVDDTEHPATVVRRWEYALRRHYGLDEALAPTLQEAAALVLRHLHTYAQDPAGRWSLLAGQARGSRRHLEDVLRIGEQIDTGAPCLSCGDVPLRKVWGDSEHEDSWACPRCHRAYDDATYRLAVAEDARTAADWLTAPEMALRLGVGAGTIRAWASKGEVDKRRDSGRTVYRVADVQRRAGEES